MTIHPVYDSQADQSTAYDTVWTQTEMPAHETSPLERVMLAEDKLYVVLAVVLIIWIGLTFFVLRTDRKLDRLERTLSTRIPESSHDRF